MFWFKFCSLAAFVRVHYFNPWYFYLPLLIGNAFLYLIAVYFWSCAGPAFNWVEVVSYLAGLPLHHRTRHQKLQFRRTTLWMVIFRMVLCLKRFTFHLVANVFTFARAVLKTVPALYTPCGNVATALMDTKGTSKDSNSAVWCNGGKNDVCCSFTQCTQRVACARILVWHGIVVVMSTNVNGFLIPCPNVPFFLLSEPGMSKPLFQTSTRTLP